MKMARRLRFVGLVLCAAALVVASGCEDEDTDVTELGDYESLERDTLLPPDDTPTETVTEDLTVDPATTDLAQDGDMVSITASGGVSPYTWSVQDVFRGSIVDSGGNSAAYQRSSAGDNVVICEDSEGRKAYTVINQP